MLINGLDPRRRYIFGERRSAAPGPVGRGRSKEEWVLCQSDGFQAAVAAASGANPPSLPFNESLAGQTKAAVNSKQHFIERRNRFS
jgi:hypothetical protein